MMFRSGLILAASLFALVGCQPDSSGSGASGTEQGVATASGNPAEAMYDTLAQAGMKTDGPLEYFYFFYSEDQAGIDRLQQKFAGQGYKTTVEQPAEQGDSFGFEMSKVETLTREQFVARYAEFDKIAQELQLESFDGIEAGAP